MSANHRLQPLLPWLVATLVLVPLLVAWQLQRTQHAQDVKRFRFLIGDATPRVSREMAFCQDIASQLITHARKGLDWSAYSPSGEWRSTHPECHGFGYASWEGGSLRLVYLDMKGNVFKLHEGDDLLNNAVIRQVWENALKTGGINLSAPVPLDIDDSTSLVLFARPAYSRFPPPTSQTERETNVRGLAFCVLDQNLAWEQAMKTVDRNLLSIEFLPNDAPAVSGDFVRTVGLSSGPFSRKMRITPGPEFYRNFNRGLPGLVISVGLLLAALTFWLAREQIRRRAEVEALNQSLDERVSSLTRQLREENAQLHVARAELLQALGREHESSELKGRVITTISHEFRTPLSIILSASEILRVYQDRLDPDQRSQQLLTIEDSVRRMSNLIQSVLAFSKAGVGRLSFNPEQQIPAELFRQNVDEALSATSRRCPIFLSMDESMTSPGWIDPALLQIILSNLLGNAAKYSPEGSPVYLKAWRMNENLMFSISDAGIGIPLPDQTGLFQAFKRGANTHGIPGTGLGLSITRTCAELHRGSIHVSSTPGQGSVFTVTLPVFVPNPPSTSLPPFSHHSDGHNPAH